MTNLQGFIDFMHIYSIVVSKENLDVFLLISVSDATIDSNVTVDCLIETEDRGDLKDPCAIISLTVFQLCVVEFNIIASGTLLA